MHQLLRASHIYSSCRRFWTTPHALCCYSVSTPLSCSPEVNWRSGRNPLNWWQIILMMARNHQYSTSEGGDARPCTAKGLGGRRLGSSCSIICCNHSRYRTLGLFTIASQVPFWSLLSKRLACDIRSVGEQEVITIEMQRPNAGSFGTGRIRDGFTTGTWW